MGSMFRSESMTLCQLFVQPEAAYSFLSILGEEGTAQFKDLNEKVNALQRKYVNEVRRCDEMERQLHYIEAEMKKEEIKIPECAEIPRTPNPREMSDLEARLDKTESEIRELSSHSVNVRKNFSELSELKHVLEKTPVFFSEKDEASEVLWKTLVNEEKTAQVNRGKLGFVAGVISRERVHSFERMLWRIIRGNIFFRQTPIDNPLEDPVTRGEVFKSVFVAFFQGDELNGRVQKVCSGFRAVLYDCPESNVERQEMLDGLRLRLEDKNTVRNYAKIFKVM